MSGLFSKFKGGASVRTYFIFYSELYRNIRPPFQVLRSAANPPQMAGQMFELYIEILLTSYLRLGNDKPRRGLIASKKARRPTRAHTTREDVAECWTHTA